MINMGKKCISILMLSSLCMLLIANIAAADTYLYWCGEEWWVRSGAGNPGGNAWNNSANSVWVDENQNLHLTIQKVGDTWYSTEVDTTSADYSYGVYKWTVSSPILNLDPNIVAAMFFRHNDTNEIDIEATQWGWTYSDRLSYSVQPNAYQSAISYDSSYQDATDVTYQFDWEPTYVHFTAKLADGTVISDWNCTDQTSIPQVTGGVAMQMWLMNNLAPISGQNAEMILSDFSYVPSTGNTTTDTPGNTTDNEQTNDYFNWCGQEWWVRSGTGNPGGNTWSNLTNSVWVDENQNLHLTIRKVGDTWYSTEVSTASDNYTYGVYKWTVSSPILNLDPNIVAAMVFLNGNSEIDIDATQWGWTYSDRLSYSVAPNAYQSAISYDSSYQDAKDVTYQFDWEPTYVHFTAKLADGTVISDWNCTDQTSIPQVTGGSILMQMWLMSNLAPLNGQNAEMVFSDFSYVPSTGNTTDKNDFI